MDYWKMLVEKFVGCPSKKTFLHGNFEIKEKKKRPLRKMSNQQKKERLLKYYVNTSLGPIYFTKREAQTMVRFLKGYTNADVAKEVGLSPRTIDFYVGNMKAKCRAKSKIELIKMIVQSDFLRANDLDQIG